MTIGDRPDTFARQLGSMVGQQQWGTWGGRLRGTPTSPDRLPQQAQGKGGGLFQPGFWVLVAASNAPLEWKRQAHFVCTGTDDQDTLAAAAAYLQTLLPEENVSDATDPYNSPVWEDAGGLMLSPGNYWLSDTWNPGDTGPTTIVGIPNATVLHATDTFSQNGTAEIVYLAGTDGASTGTGWFRPIWMSGLTINGGGYVNPSTQLTGLRVSRGAFLQDVQVIGCSLGVTSTTFAGVVVLDRFLVEKCQTGVNAQGDVMVVTAGTFHKNKTDLNCNGDLHVVRGCLFDTSGAFGGDSSSVTSRAILMAGPGIVEDCSFLSGAYTAPEIVVTSVGVTVSDVVGTPDVDVTSGGHVDVDGALGAVTVDSASTIRRSARSTASSWAILGEQQATGLEMVLEHVAVSAVVTSDPEDIDVTLSSDWGIQAADGDPYYDPAGATSGEEAELLHDPVTDAYFLREIA